MSTALDEVAEAYADRDVLAQRLARYNARTGEAVRRARAEGHPWRDIAARAGTSEVAVYNASRRTAMSNDQAAATHHPQCADPSGGRGIVPPYISNAIEAAAERVARGKGPAVTQDFDALVHGETPEPEPWP